VVAIAATALGAGLVAPADARPSHHPTPAPSPIALPTGFEPEGITIDRKGRAYLGSRVDGDIYAVNLRTGKGRVISQGPGTASLGLKVDPQGRLFVAGAGAGVGRLVSARSGRLLATYHFTTNTSFVNDVVLTKRSAWFTDSNQAQLYQIARPRHGKISTAVRTLPLTGDWVQAPRATVANGIVQTPDRRALLVVQTNTGFLFRINPRTGVARRVDLGATLLTNGDGLLLRGRTLYAVQNQDNQIAVLKLNRAGTHGTLVKTLKSSQFDIPTTVAAYRGSLYLPNARFTVANPTTADYWITRVRP
jgi:sugar lactone lactonase YvrE